MHCLLKLLPDLLEHKASMDNKDSKVWLALQMAIRDYKAIRETWVAKVHRDGWVIKDLLENKAFLAVLRGIRDYRDFKALKDFKAYRDIKVT